MWRSRQGTRRMAPRFSGSAAKILASIAQTSELSLSVYESFGCSCCFSVISNLGGVIPSQSRHYKSDSHNLKVF